MTVSSRPNVQMEQQLLRMKDLLYKMKEQLHAQKVHYEAALANAGGAHPGSHDRTAELEAENKKLQDEKKQINARLQLANRKLQIMDNNLDKREELVRASNPDQEQEIELLKQQKYVLEKQKQTWKQN